MVPAGFTALVLCVLLPASLAGEQAPDRSAWEILERAESLSSGSGGRVDEREARALFERAEATGEPVAGLRVAILRHLGRSGFPADPARAAGLAGPVLEAVRGLAETGDPAAQATWAMALLIGVGVPADPAAALPWLEKAAGQGQTWAMVNLGWIYGTGVGVAVDPIRSLEWYGKAAERGNAGAMLEVGLAHLHGVGTPEDRARGLDWLRRAAERRHPRAMAELADLLLAGDRVPSDLPKAVLLYERAAAAGVVSAARELARIYENGWYGLPKDVEKARIHYRRAAELGDDVALGWLKYEKLLGRE